MIDVGGQVVCIDDDWKPAPGPLGISAPVRGQVYTVREIGKGVTTADGSHHPDFVGIKLEEIHNPPDIPTPGRGEVVFNIIAFRPVKKTSIEEFTKILDNAPKRLEPA